LKETGDETDTENLHGMVKTEFETAVERLQALPDEVKTDIAPELNQYLNTLEDLRRAIRTGLESGEAPSGEQVLNRLERTYRNMSTGTGQS
jgi:hypothetical protein